MHIPTHILSGWCVGNCFALTPRERLGCMIAASIADLDGLGFFFGEQAFWRFHHVVGHGLPAAVVCSAALLPLARVGRDGNSAAALPTRRDFRPALHLVKAFFLFLLCFHLHLLMDLLGSGTLWPIEYFWPFSSRPFFTPYGWPLTSWQNDCVAAGLLVWTVGIAVVCRRTPLEVIAPRLDARLVRAGGASAV